MVFKLHFWSLQGIILKILIFVLFSSMFLFSYELEQKLIVYTDKNSSIALENLLKLKVYFIDTPELKELQDKYQFEIVMEKLSHYSMVVVKPISNSVELHTQLYIYLNPLFSDIFFLNQTKVLGTGKKIVYQNQKIKKTINYIDYQEKDSEKKVLLNEIGLQWLILLLLSIIGLGLSINRRKNIIYLGKRQKNLSQNQEKIEKEIINLGVDNE